MDNPDNPRTSNVPLFRNVLAFFIILAAVIGIYYISTVYLGGKKDDAPERIFTAILPLLATWVGTVLAFYFGRENFEAASNRYEKIISKLNPELLDDVAVRQIMISDKTMVSKELSAINGEAVKDIISFLDSINKSRLPILEDGKAKYIVHKSAFLSAIHQPENADMTFAEFATQNDELIRSFIEIDGDIPLEQIRTRISKETGISDVFVVDSAKKVVGWLTDTLILRYTSLNKPVTT